MVDLDHSQQHVVRKILRHRFPGRDARIFGSRASGSSKPWSDLDLVILGHEPVADLAMAQARADFEESDLPFRVDLARWIDLPERIRENIQRYGQRV